MLNQSSDIVMVEVKTNWTGNGFVATSDCRMTSAKNVFSSLIFSASASLTKRRSELGLGR
ncbi:hypothetical protein [Paraglaciecola sp.]|uniref:hypothetical protein n=1 Tax=Paraglaciecola sp. TaxID=1920173 RepID=UPI003EF3E8B4